MNDDEVQHLARIGRYRTRLRRYLTAAVVTGVASTVLTLSGLSDIGLLFAVVASVLATRCTYWLGRYEEASDMKLSCSREDHEIV